MIDYALTSIQHYTIITVHHARGPRNFIMAFTKLNSYAHRHMTSSQINSDASEQMCSLTNKNIAHKGCNQ